MPGPWLVEMSRLDWCDVLASSCRNGSDFDYPLFLIIFYTSADMLNRSDMSAAPSFPPGGLI